MSRYPRSSPWGEVRHCDIMRRGVFMVTTENHGGIMIRKTEAEFLSDYARKIAVKDRNYLCFEQDCDEQLVIRELIDKKLYEIPDRMTDKNKAIENMNRSVQSFHPEYWETRKKSLSAESKPQTLAKRLEAGKQKASMNNAECKIPDIPSKNKSATEH